MNKIKIKSQSDENQDNEQWFDPQVETGWHKDTDRDLRRRKVLQSHNGDDLSAARGLQALANVTTDPETKREARRDAEYFFSVHRKHTPIYNSSSSRLSPKFRRLK